MLFSIVLVAVLFDSSSFTSRTWFDPITLQLSFPTWVTADSISPHIERWWCVAFSFQIGRCSFSARVGRRCHLESIIQQSGCVGIASPRKSTRSRSSDARLLVNVVSCRMSGVEGERLWDVEYSPTKVRKTSTFSRTDQKSRFDSVE